MIAHINIEKRVQKYSITIIDQSIRKLILNNAPMSANHCPNLVIVLEVQWNTVCGMSISKACNQTPVHLEVSIILPFTLNTVIKYSDVQCLKRSENWNLYVNMTHSTQLVTKKDSFILK